MPAESGFCGKHSPTVATATLPSLKACSVERRQKTSHPCMLRMQMYAKLWIEWKSVPYLLEGKQRQSARAKTAGCKATPMAKFKGHVVARLGAWRCAMCTNEVGILLVRRVAHFLMLRMLSRRAVALASLFVLLVLAELGGPTTEIVT